MASGPLKGAIWIVGGMALIALADNFVYLVAERMGLWQFHAVRSGLILGIGLVAAWALGRLGLFRPKRPRRVIERSLFHVAALFLYFGALPAVGIATAAAGLFTSPVWVVLVTTLILRERVGPRRVLAGVIGFAGVCLVLGVGQRALDPLGLAAVLAGLSYSLGVIWTRRHCEGEPAVTLAIWQFAGLMLAGMLGLVAAPVLVPALDGVEGSGFIAQGWRPLDWRILGIVFLTGIAGIVATICLAAGYRMGESTLMSVFDFSFILWASFFAWALFGDAPSMREAAGIALIIAAGLLAVWSGQRRMGA